MAGSFGPPMATPLRASHFGAGLRLSRLASGESVEPTGSHLAVCQKRKSAHGGRLFVSGGEGDRHGSLQQKAMTTNKDQQCQHVLADYRENVLNESQLKTISSKFKWYTRWHTKP